MLILGIYTGGHDANAALFDDYRLLAAVQQERLTREKGAGSQIPHQAIDECLAIAGVTAKNIDAVALSRTKYPESLFTQFPPSKKIKAQLRHLLGREKCKWLSGEMVRLQRIDIENIFDGNSILNSLGCRTNIPLHFYNHHEAHALPCLFHTQWDGSVLLYTADGGGDQVQYSHRFFDGDTITTLYGGDDLCLQPRRVDSVGTAYSFATKALGYIPNRHEGKLTGLAAHGNPALMAEISQHFRIDETGQINSTFASYAEMGKYLNNLFVGHKREDVAASIQLFLEETVLKSIGKLLNRSSARRLGLSGGVHANVRLNQRIAEELPVDEVFIYPAMSDAGLSIGGILSFLLERDGMEKWLANRWLLEHLYFGRSHGNAIDKTLSKAEGIKCVEGEPAQIAAKELAAGRIVAIFNQSMEYGPRALGARSILASPADSSINDSLNKRLARTEFMPFAPVVAKDDATKVFDVTSVNSYAAEFMTITCSTKNAWKRNIPAVVHVDGSARPQIITRDPNPLYFDILQEFKLTTGLPVLINTSLNAHEEPIINTPLECLKVLQDQRVEAVVTNNGYYTGQDCCEQ